MIERNVQWLGVAVALVVAVFSLRRYRARLFRPLDALVGLGFALALAAVALYPPVLDPLRGLLTMNNRWNAAFFVLTMLLFGLYLHSTSRVNALRDQVAALVRTLAQREYAQARAEGAASPHIAVVIPAFNEERAIRGVLATLPTEVLGCRVEPVVVLDGGTDNSEVLLRSAGYIVAYHALNSGNPAAVRTGFDIALRQGADVIVTLDADGQHDPTQLEALVRPLLRDEADYVLGNRFTGGYDEAGSAHRGVVFFSWLLRRLTGLPVYDCTNGFRGFRAEALRKLELREPRFIGPELLFEARRKGLRFRHVPVRVRRRAEGESKMPRHFRYPLAFLWTILRVWLR